MTFIKAFHFVFTMRERLRSRLQPALIVIMAAILVMATIFAGCNQDDYHTLTRSAAGIADGLQQMQQSNEGAFNAGFLSPAESVKLAQCTGDATRANDIFVAALKAAKKVNAANKSELLLDFGNTVSSISTLSGCVSLVKNPDARQKMMAVVAFIVTSSNAIAVILEQQAPKTVPVNQWRTYGPDVNYFFDHNRRAARAEGFADEARSAARRRRVARTRQLSRPGDARPGRSLDREGEGRPGSASNC